jgi:cytoskeletal protein CcmA (bactofilin family)
MHKKLIYGLLTITILVFMLGIVMVKPAQAVSINDTGTVKSGETIDDDLLLGGETVQMDGTVNGVLIASGTTVTINGTVNGDLIAMGQTVILSDTGVVTGNIFCGAQNITVNGKVEGSLFAGGSSAVLGAASSIERNVYFGGYSLNAQTGSVIGKDLRAGLYQAILKGEVDHDVVASAEAVQLTGKVGRNIELWLSDSGSNKTSIVMPSYFPAAIAPGLRVDPSAQVAGKLIYTSPQKYNIGIVPGGGIVYKTPAVVEKKPAFGPELVRQETNGGFRVWHAVSTLISLLLIGALAVGLFGKCFTRTVEIAQKRTLASAGVGFLAVFLAIPVFLIAAMVILLAGVMLTFVSLGGLAFPIFGLGLGALGLAATAFIVLVSLVSKLIVSYLIGKLILEAFKANLSSGWQKALPLLIGALVYAVLSALPFVGWIFDLAAAVIGTGAVWFLLVPGKSTVNTQPQLPLPNVTQN